jgi:phosphoadenosine phosphosulfate reductase
MDEQLYLLGMGMDYESKVKKAILTLQQYEFLALKHSPDGYYLCYSGGKDSDVILHLAKAAGVKFKAYYSQTTIDPPEVVRHIRTHREVEWVKPDVNFFRSVESIGLPTRVRRWCCRKYKEDDGNNTVRIIGVRAAESKRRAAMWNVISQRRKKDGYYLCPILLWSDQDVWKYLIENNVPYCSLYDEGWKRLGCIGCPMSDRKKQFEKWPRFERLWKRAAERYFDANKGEIRRDGKTRLDGFETAEDFWNWWLSDKAMPKDDDCQMGLF